MISFTLKRLRETSLKIRAQKTVMIFEFAARIYLAYMLIEYGISKLSGGMFTNATPQILNTALKDVDLFHLTWYWFFKNKLLTTFVGALQIIAAGLLVFNRTVLIGVSLALPILISILLVDIYCVGSIPLIIRVVFYICLVLSFAVYRWQTCKRIFNQLILPATYSPPYKPLVMVAAVAIAIIAIAIFELVLLKGLSFMFY